MKNTIIIIFTLFLILWGFIVAISVVQQGMLIKDRMDRMEEILR